MGSEERRFPLLPEQEEFSAEKYVADVDSYEGNSQRIFGFRRIKTVISGLSHIKTIDPLIILPSVYRDFIDDPQNGHVEAISAHIWSTLDGENNPLIVRRLFSDPEGVVQEGPRSGNVLSQGVLTSEIINFFEYYKKHYEGSDITSEIMVHKIIDAGNPPKLESPYLPFPGGDVVPWGNNKFQIRATFGADESIQDVPADVWEATLSDDGSVEIMQTEKALKSQSYVPDTGSYRTIEIPDEYQKISALNNIEVLSLAYACKNMLEMFGPYRLEFDGTRVRDQDYLFIIESAPFITPQNSKEAVEHFAVERTKPVIIVNSREEIEKLGRDNFPIVHIPKVKLQRGEERGYLRDLSIIAKEKNLHLLVLVGGNIATEHAVRMFHQNGHDVIFCEKAEFFDGEPVRVYSENGSIFWEKEDPIDSQEYLSGRTSERIGGKAFGFQKLFEHGFDTSPFFVIESSLYRRIIKESGCLPLLKELDTAPIESLGQLTSNIQQKILECGQLPTDLISAAADKLDGSSFAVRSSANCEDGRKSFAGMFKTDLKVPRDYLCETILKVLASCVSESAVRAARVVDLKPSDMRMAVIIQQMVKSQKGGTIFTKDHMADDRDILRIEAVPGQGESLVSGEAMVHHSIKYDKLAKKVIESDGNILLGFQIQRLAELGLDVETKLAEGPQDIEWAMDESGKIYILQARPL